MPKTTEEKMKLLKASGFSLDHDMLKQFLNMDFESCEEAIESMRNETRIDYRDWR
jgi:hypothetical protein